MGIGFKKLYWVGAGAVFLLLLLFALALIIPRVVDSAWLKSTIQAQVAKQVTGEFDFQKADLVILPHPAVSLHQVSLNIPETAQVSLVTIRVYPRLLPLLFGNIELDKIVIDNPDFSLPLPEKSAKRQEKRKPLTPSAFLETVSKKLSPVLAAILDLEIDLHQGTLRFFSGDVQVFLVTDINGEFKLSDQSLSATISSLTTLHENEKIIAQVENLRGNIQYSEQVIEITVDDLSLSYPQVQLSGIFKFDQTAPHARLDITSQKTDITKVREVLPLFINALYADLPVVEEIFDVIRGGTVSQASLQFEGESPADLAVFESMLIQAQVTDGEVWISDPGLDLRGVTGDIIIAQGILEGQNLQARLGNSTGSRGTLKLGLVQKETTPFNLDLRLNADLSEVPPLLKKLLPNENIHHHLSLFESLQGTAQGRLTLGDSLESIKVRVEVDNINAQAKYKPIPYPISVDGGSILYEELKIHSQGVKGKIGNSTFSNYSDRMNWEGEPAVDVQSGTFQLVMDEIFPWLTSNKKLAEELGGIQDISGIVEITAKSVKGPLLQPTKLLYELHGALKDITITASKLPAPLNIKSGQAYIMPDKISFENFQAELLDSSLTYSGVLQDFIAGRTNADIIVTEATLGHEVNTWLVEEIGAPEEYQFRTPLLISRMNVDWTREELLDLQGDFSIKNGPIFSIDIMLNPDELVLRNLFIKNKEDKASIKLDLRKRAIGAEFQGSLSKQTIDKILLYRDVDHNAWIEGDIKFHINLDSFADSTASGSLEGGDFIFPWGLEKPLVFESYSLSATDKTINLNSAVAEFENKRFSLNGAVSLAPERLSMDFDVKTDTIELDKIIDAIKKEKEGDAEEKDRVGKSWNLTLGASVKINADSLLYNGYTWEPFESQITFENSYLSVEVLEAYFCNISTPAKLSFHDGKISLDFQMAAKDQEITELMVCLGEGERQASGTFNLKADISGNGSRDTFIKSLHGDLQFIAKEGKIYQDAQMAKVLYLLNVTNLFKGKIPDLASEGFYYDSLIIRGTMDQGVLAINPAKLEAPIMEIAANGTIDLPEKKINLLVLVAPLQTLNTIQKALPVIGKIIPSSLAAVPVEVTGDLRDIKVRTLSMSAIGTRTFGIMVDALTTPVRLMEDTSGKAK